MLPLKRISAWIPVLAGLSLFILAARAGTLTFALAALPGSLLLAGGVRALLAPDLRAPQHIATGAMFGLLLALPIGLAGGVVPGLLTLALSGISLIAGGWHQLGLQPTFEEVPAPAPTLLISGPTPWWIFIKIKMPTTKKGLLPTLCAPLTAITLAMLALP